MTERTKASLWLEAAARHLIDESILGCSEVFARFTGARGKSIQIVIARSPVRSPRGKLSVIIDGIWVHTDDSDNAACGSSLKFEKVCAYAERSSISEPLFGFLKRELGELGPIDLQMEGTDRAGNVCFETVVYSDDGISFTTGVTMSAAW
ncbi:MAG: hypothetical protein EKK48_19050 [Candidatus Melainabacteria bacterium]|nr:MAG: hypothetical protein EKK48_19050 [Candidatus Melainabacteria bacterium]